MAAANVQPVPWVCDAGNAFADDRDLTVAVHQHVDDVVAIEVAALDHHRTGAHRPQRAGGAGGVLRGADRQPGQHLRLGNVGRDDSRQRQQRPAYRLDGVGGQQVVAALGHHHRVDDQVGQPQPGDRRRDRLDDCRGRQHAGLDGVAAEVAGHGLDLGDDERRRRQVHAVTARVSCAVSAVMAEVP